MGSPSPALAPPRFPPCPKSANSGPSNSAAAATSPSASNSRTRVDEKISPCIALGFDHCDTEPVFAAFLSENAWISATALSEKEVVANRSMLDGESLGKDDAHEFRRGEPCKCAVERDHRSEAAAVSRKQLKLARKARQPEERPVAAERTSWGKARTPSRPWEARPRPLSPWRHPARRDGRNARRRKCRLRAKRPSRCWGTSCQPGTTSIPPLYFPAREGIIITASPSRTIFSPTEQAQAKIALFRCSIKSEMRTVAVT